MDAAMSNAEEMRRSRVFRRAQWLCEDRQNPERGTEALHHPDPKPDEVTGLRAQAEWLHETGDETTAAVEADVLAEALPASEIGACPDLLGELRDAIRRSVAFARRPGNAHSAGLVAMSLARARRHLGPELDADLIALVALAAYVADDRRTPATGAYAARVCLAFAHAHDPERARAGDPGHTATTRADEANAHGVTAESALAGAYAALVDRGDVDACVRHAEFARRACP